MHEAGHVSVSTACAPTLLKQRSVNVLYVNDELWLQCNDQNFKFSAGLLFEQLLTTSCQNYL